MVSAQYTGYITCSIQFAWSGSRHKDKVWSLEIPLAEQEDQDGAPLAVPQQPWPLLIALHSNDFHQTHTFDCYLHNVIQHAMTSGPCVITSFNILVTGHLNAQTPLSPSSTNHECAPTALDPPCDVCMAINPSNPPRWSLHDFKLRSTTAAASLHDADAARRK